VSDEAGQAGGDLVGSDGRHITLRFPPPVLHPSVSGVASNPVDETPQGAAGSELGGESPEYQSLEERLALGGPNDRWFLEESLSDDLPAGLDTSSDDALVRRQRRARWIALAVMCVALALIGVAVLRGANGAREPVSLPSSPSSRTVAAQSSAPSAAKAREQPQIAARPAQPEIAMRPAQPGIATRLDQPEAARQTAGETEHAVGTAPPPADPVREGVQARTPQTSVKAPARPRRSKSAHRALRRQSTGHAEAPGRRREAERPHGMPVSEVYVNSRGELVDAQGKPLELGAADPDSGSATDPVPSGGD
jgi:hypothetical protein